MSDKTKAALEAAIEAHFVDEMDGAFNTGWVLQMSGIKGDDAQGVSRYFRETPENQAAHNTLGLINYAHVMYSAILTEEAMDDDD